MLCRGTKKKESEMTETKDLNKLSVELMGLEYYVRNGEIRLPISPTSWRVWNPLEDTSQLMIVIDKFRKLYCIYIYIDKKGFLAKIYSLDNEPRYISASQNKIINKACLKAILKAVQLEAERMDEV